MIIVRVFMKPKGIGPERLMSEAYLSNDCRGTRSTGDYDVTVSTVSHSGTGRLTTWRTGKVRGFPRLRLGVWDLLYRALRATVGERNAAPEQEPPQVSQPTVSVIQ